MDQVVFDYLNPEGPAGTAPRRRAAGARHRESLAGLRRDRARSVTASHRDRALAAAPAGASSMPARASKAARPRASSPANGAATSLLGRNEAVGGHYVIGFRELPEQAAAGVALAGDAACCCGIATTIPTAASSSGRSTASPSSCRCAKPGDDLKPEDFVAFWSDGSFGIYIHPGIWHEGVFPVEPDRPLLRQAGPRPCAGELRSRPRVRRAAERAAAARDVTSRQRQGQRIGASAAAARGRPAADRRRLLQRRLHPAGPGLWLGRALAAWPCPHRRRSTHPPRARCPACCRC